MMQPIFDKTISVPEGYAERSCLLVSYRLPLLRHCFVLCHEPADVSADVSVERLIAFFVMEAERLSTEAVGDPQAFMLVHSGMTVRKRANWHLHVFVVQHRWQKAWVYTILAAKNIALVCYGVLLKVSRRVTGR